MANRTAARKYAAALFALCREQDALEPVRADLIHLNALMQSSEEWRVFVSEPSGSKARRAEAIRRLLESHAHPLTTRFMLFLDRKNRIMLFPLIVEEWLARHDDHEGILRARLVSAAPFSEQQHRMMTDRLATRFGRRVILTEKHDPRLIGGFKLFIGDQVFDFSVESQLQQLQKRLIYA